MNKILKCDICGQSQEELLKADQSAASDPLKVNNGLFVCNRCHQNLKPWSKVQEDDEVLEDRIQDLAGRSAGEICRMSDLPFRPPYRKIVEAASRIAYDQDKYMSTWSFVTQWLDGTTVWQSEDESTKAIVDINGNIRLFSSDDPG